MSAFEIIIFGKWKKVSKSFEYDQLLQVTSGTECVIMIFFNVLLKTVSYFPTSVGLELLP